MAAYKRINHEELPTSVLGNCIDLASAAIGSTIVAVTDEFFAPATNMINPAPPQHCPGRFVDTGAWMDGWETKRHNPTYDWCIVKLGFSGSIRGFDIDTHYFTGNQAPFASVEAAFCPEGDVLAKDVQWTEILPKVELPPSCHNVFILDQPTAVYTHVRVNNIPDGGIARFRAYGNVSAIFPKDTSAVIDLAYVGNGGRCVAASDEHFGPGSNLLLPGRGCNHDDGWQTRRSREPNHSDFVIIRLGAKGHVLKLEIDTSDFHGNYPKELIIEGTNTDTEVPEASAQWTKLVDAGKVGPHGLFYFDLPSTDKVFSHLRVTIVPDGGLKRVRAYGVREGAQLPALPIEAPSHYKEGIVAVPLTPENYAAYGDVIEEGSGSHFISANMGTAEKHLNTAKVVNNHPNGGGKVQMCVFHCRPTLELPMTAKLLERHPYSSQAFMPMTDGKVRAYLVIVALNGADDRPDLSTLKAFIATSKQGINYREGVWHHPMVVLEHEADFACIVHESGIPEDDCNVVDIKETVIHVPGFQRL
ncbi:galactose-binding domain-like protein [Radiomyces spectabilis]|uniref:galactose-binding domain-like protein n=1 Tax=Radiomyces spectabilis TaxID=64574 RepID=UPI00221E638D|nr:galactose-binding domain-like protein [Radiomyces spectabilis]KAI8384224.1 galactose-binding domain-like protein [Radiomyces spectabilis]